MKHPAQEPDAISGRLVARVALGVVGTMLVALAVAYFLGGWHRQQVGDLRSDINGIETTPFSVEAQGLAAHQAAEHRLSTYGWVDRQRGIVHVPIDVAFELWLAQRRGARR